MRRTILGMIAGAVLTLAALAAAQPACPSEDSCRADYRAGGWHIEEQQP